MGRTTQRAGGTRRGFLKTLGGAGIALQTPPLLAQQAAGTRGYNILWLMSDEHNPFVAGYAGDAFAQTPALDDIARSGVEFTAAYSPDPICVPARQAFHSGRMSSNLLLAPANYEAMGPYFTRKGFQTAWFGKQHWEGLDNPFMDLGLDSGKVAKERFAAAGLPLPEESRLVEDAMLAYWSTDLNEDTVTTEQALAFLDGVKKKQRFFLGVSLTKPHFPFCIQERYYQRHASSPIPEPVVTQAMLDNLSTALKADRSLYGIARLTTEQTRFCRAIYYGMVSYVDEQIGKVMKKLRQLGLRDNTIVIYMADHGEMLGQHGIWYKNAFLEGSARVPLLISLPSAFGPRRQARIDAPASAIDLYPTLCELCALSPPATLEGRSLVPLLDGRENGGDREVFSENKRGGIPARMIRTSKYKYCYYEDGVEQLYDMRGSDRHTEAVNLAGDPAYAGTKKRLKERALDGWNPDGLNDSGD
ncbi:MAG TPA: sulfatase-like hydrolase/transferase [Ideonella sp.]|nr:sulfatase-like hydrolase/transferase [Ideonella sp.]